MNTTGGKGGVKGDFHIHTYYSDGVFSPEKMNHYPSLAHDECAAGVLGGRDGEADAPAAGDGGV